MAQEVQDPAQAPAKRKKFKVNFAPGEVEDGDEQAFADLQTKRRKTREKQYQLEASVDRNQEDLQDVNSSFFDDVMDSLNEQHRNIMHVREAQQDSNVTRKISMNLVKRVQKLDSNSRISLKKFLVCLKEKFSEADDDDDNEDGGDGGYDEEEDAASRSGRASSKRKAAVSMADERDAAMSWTKLGAAAGRLFLSPVGMETMLGPISKPKVVKSRCFLLNFVPIPVCLSFCLFVCLCLGISVFLTSLRQKLTPSLHLPSPPPPHLAIVRKAKQKDAPVALINPEKIDNLDMTQGGASSGQGDDDDVTEVTFARISKLDKVVKARSAKKKKKGDDSNGDTFKKFAVLDVLFDSKDVVQTMENMFDFAFLIKEGEVLTQYVPACVSVTCHVCVPPYCMCLYPSH